MWKNAVIVICLAEAVLLIVADTRVLSVSHRGDSNATDGRSLEETENGRKGGFGGYGGFGGLGGGLGHFGLFPFMCKFSGCHRVERRDSLSLFLLQGDFTE